MDTTASPHIKQLLDGFSTCSYVERVARLLQTGLITEKDIDILSSLQSFTQTDAEHLIENSIGVFAIPLGFAVNFVINGKDYIIPMAVEESSIIAAASKTAKWIRNQGELTAENLSWLSIGQIQVPHVKNFNAFKKLIESNKQSLLDNINKEVASSMVFRGGGARDIIVRKIDRNEHECMAVIHVMIDTCYAMGANIVNQICEFLKPHIEKLTKEKVGLCILSNLAEGKLTRAHAVIRNINPDEGKLIEEASLFAALDPYRAATNNKGVMNAIDGVLIATGNDWRAVEAGAHAYAARSGVYTSLTRWRMVGDDLHGDIELPIAVGIVGGVTAIHPTAKTCLKVLHVSSAKNLAEVIAAVGLVQNLGALRALATEGIIKGHMGLHIKNLLLANGATKEELPFLEGSCKVYFQENKKITSHDVKMLIQLSRKK